MNGIGFSRLRLLVVFEIETMERALAELLAEDYPSRVAPALIRQLSSSLYSQRSELDRIVEDFSFDPIGAEARLRSQHRKVLTCLRYLRWIEDAATRSVPWSLVPSIERLASNITPGQDLLISCAPEPTYQITFVPPSVPSSGIGKTNILEIPATHRLDSFLHILIGHELFHPVAYEFVKGLQPSISGELRSACSDLLEPSDDQLPLFGGNTLGDLVEETRTMWMRAMEEITCDLGCAALFGPACLMALFSYGLTFEPDEAPVEPGFYPPFRFRLRTVLSLALDNDDSKAAIENLLGQLRNRELDDYAERLSEFMDHLREFTAEEDDLDKINQDPLLQIAYKAVQNLLEKAWEFAQAGAARSGISWTSTVDEVPAHLRRFEMLVPAGEFQSSGGLSGEPSSLPAIAFAAWLKELNDDHLRRSGSESYSVEPYLRSCRLTLKSVEDAEVRRLYSSRESE